jgi:undecaprenyl-diphosphatase
MISGTSRSASTIIGGMCLGCSRGLSAEFSLFLAIPTMIAASGYSILKYGGNLAVSEWIALGIGFVTAFFVAWAVIAFFMAYIQKHDFKAFGWYRIALGIVLLTLYFCKVI